MTYPKSKRNTRFNKVLVLTLIHLFNIKFGNYFKNKNYSLKEVVEKTIKIINSNFEKSDNTKVYKSELINAIHIKTGVLKKTIEEYLRRYDKMGLIRINKQNSVKTINLTPFGLVIAMIYKLFERKEGSILHYKIEKGLEYLLSLVIKKLKSQNILLNIIIEDYVKSETRIYLENSVSKKIELILKTIINDKTNIEVKRHPTKLKKDKKYNKLTLKIKSKKGIDLILVYLLLLYLKDIKFQISDNETIKIKNSFVSSIEILKDVEVSKESAFKTSKSLFEKRLYLEVVNDDESKELVKTIINFTEKSVNKEKLEILIKDLESKMIKEMIDAIKMFSFPSDKNVYFISFKKYFKKLDGDKVMRNEIRFSKGKLTADKFFNFVVHLSPKRDFVYFVTFLLFLDPLLLNYLILRSFIKTRRKNKKKIKEEKAISLGYFISNNGENNNEIMT